MFCPLRGVQKRYQLIDQQSQILPFYDYFHAKNLRDSSSPSRDTDDQRILQSDWLKAILGHNWRSRSFPDIGSLKNHKNTVMHHFQGKENKNINELIFGFFPPNENFSERFGFATSEKFYEPFLKNQSVSVSGLLIY